MFFDLVSKFQSRRIDDQRCSFDVKPSVQANNISTKPSNLPVTAKTNMQGKKLSRKGSSINVWHGLNISLEIVEKYKDK